MGLEALSRGARQSIFIDKSKKSLDVCRRNIISLNLKDCTFTYIHDSQNLPNKHKECPKADLIFLDPPYQKNMIVKSLRSIIEKGWCHHDAFFVIETSSQENFENAQFVCESKKTYGDTTIHMGSLKYAAIDHG